MPASVTSRTSRPGQQVREQPRRPRRLDRVVVRHHAARQSVRRGSAASRRTRRVSSAAITGASASAAASRGDASSGRPMARPGDQQRSRCAVCPCRLPAWASAVTAPAPPTMAPDDGIRGGPAGRSGGARARRRLRRAAPARPGYRTGDWRWPPSSRRRCPAAGSGAGWARCWSPRSARSCGSTGCRSRTRSSSTRRTTSRDAYGILRHGVEINHVQQRERAARAAAATHILATGRRVRRAPAARAR